MRSIKDVEKYLTLYPLLIIDKRVDITGLNLHTNAELEKIWAVPFFDLEKTIQDSILQKSFPSFALEDGLQRSMEDAESPRRIVRQ